MPAETAKKGTRHPALVALERLLLGGTVEMDGHHWKIAPATDGQLSVCVVGHDDTGRTRLLRNDIPLGVFVQMTTKLPPDDLAIMAANNAMTLNRRQQAKLPVYGNLTVPD